MLVHVYISQRFLLLLLTDAAVYPSCRLIGPPPQKKYHKLMLLHQEKLQAQRQTRMSDQPIVPSPRGIGRRTSQCQADLLQFKSQILDNDGQPGREIKT